MGVDAVEQYSPESSSPRHIDEFGPTFHLFKSDTTPDADTVEADLTEADFSGYASDNPSQAFFKNEADERFEHQNNAVVFSHNGGGTSNTIYGWYAKAGNARDATGALIDDIVAIERFASPINMSELGDSIRVHLHKHSTGVDS